MRHLHSSKPRFAWKEFSCTQVLEENPEGLKESKGPLQEAFRKQTALISAQEINCCRRVEDSGLRLTAHLQGSEGLAALGVNAPESQTEKAYFLLQFHF